MERFWYYARHANGEFREATIEAENQDDAINKLHTQGAFILNIKVDEIKKPEEEKKPQPKATQPKVEAEKGEEASEELRKLLGLKPEDVEES